MTNYTVKHGCRGRQHAVAVKRAYRLASREVAQSAEPPPLVEEPVVEDGLLVQDTDLFPKRHLTDIVIKGTAWAPAGRTVESLDVAMILDGVPRTLKVFGQRTLHVAGRSVSFSRPEAFQSVPLTWAEAYGGTDALNREAGDVWDLKALGESMGRDLEYLNLNRYRRNPFGKGYILGLQPGHDGLPLPRVELAHDLLRPERLALENPLNWYFQPLPACFEWMPHPFFPRCAFLGERLVGRLNEQVPAGTFPESVYGYSRDDLLKVVPAHELVAHPRAFNGAHPAWQVPHLTGSAELVLRHLDPDHPEFAIPIPTAPPRVRLEVPGERKTYRADARLSNLVIDMNDKTLSATWHALFETTYPTLEDKFADIRHEVNW